MAPKSNRICKNEVPEPYLFRHEISICLWDPRAFGRVQDKRDFRSDLGADLPPRWPPNSLFFRNFKFPRSLQNPRGASIQSNT